MFFVPAWKKIYISTILTVQLKNTPKIHSLQKEESLGVSSTTILLHIRHMTDILLHKKIHTKHIMTSTWAMASIGPGRGLGVFGEMVPSAF